MTYATAKDTRQYTLTHSVLIAFSLMGFALANRYITILGQCYGSASIPHNVASRIVTILRTDPYTVHGECVDDFWGIYHPLSIS